MASLKKEIQMPVADVSDLLVYAQLDAEIKKLEAQKAEVAGRIKLTVMGIPDYDHAAKYVWANIIRTSHRVTNEIDQMAAFEAFKKPKLRALLFPTGIQFKPGADKPLAEAHGLLLKTWSENPVIEITKNK
jgi:hypothetical protein